MAFWNRNRAPAPAPGPVVEKTAPEPATATVIPLETKALSGVPAFIFDNSVTATQWALSGGGATGYFSGMGSGVFALRDPTMHSLVGAIITKWADTLQPLSFAIERRADEIRREDYPIINLLEHPGHGWTGGELKRAIVEGLIAVGNAYMLYESRESMKVLDWRLTRPPTYQTPWYEWTDPWTGMVSKYDPGDIIHLRWRRGPDGITGIGPLMGTAGGEMYSDYTAQSYTTALLSNMGVPGLMLSPLFESSDISPDEANAISMAINHGTGQGGQGNAVVLSKPFRIDEMSGVSGIADTRRLRWVSEERICAACKMPAALLNIGTGSEQTRVGATMESLVRLFWAANVIPFMQNLAEQLSEQLLWRFMDERRWRLVPTVEKAPAVRQILAAAQAADLANALAAYHGGLIGWQEANLSIGGEGIRPPDLIAEPEYRGGQPRAAPLPENTRGEGRMQEGGEISRLAQGET